MQLVFLSILASSCPLLQLFASSMLDQSHKLEAPSNQFAIDSQKQSVATKFKGQLYILMQCLENTTPHFIRCIKPNSKQQLPGIYEKDLVLQQLRCFGVFLVVRIARCGYPNRITHQEFSKRYRFLLPDKSVSQDPLSISVAALQQFNVLPEFYQVCYTKLYFRMGQIGTPEDSRKRVLQSVIGLQKSYRRYKARSQLMELKTRVSKLQSFIFGENSRSMFCYKKTTKPITSLNTSRSISVDFKGFGRAAACNYTIAIWNYLQQIFDFLGCGGGPSKTGCYSRSKFGSERRVNLTNNI